MITKFLIIILFLFILYNLAAGLVHMMKDKSQSDKMVKSLMWRIGLSVGAFLLLLLAYALGLITPHGILPK